MRLTNRIDVYTYGVLSLLHRPAPVRMSLAATVAVAVTIAEVSTHDAMHWMD